MMKFKSISGYKARGLDFLVIENPRYCENFDWIKNEIVEIDDKRYLVKGVEAHSILGHHRGEKIGLCVEKVK